MWISVIVLTGHQSIKLSVYTSYLVSVRTDTVSLWSQGSTLERWRLQAEGKEWESLASHWRTGSLQHPDCENTGNILLPTPFQESRIEEMRQQCHQGRQKSTWINLIQSKSKKYEIITLNCSILTEYHLKSMVDYLLLLMGQVSFHGSMHWGCNHADNK